MATLLVGANKVPFHVHLDILCEASSVFEAAFCGEYKEASKYTMTLPEDSPDAFEGLTQWLYFKNFPFNETAAKGSPAEAEELYLQSAYLYVAADKYNIPELKDDIIDRMCCIQHERGITPPQKTVIDYIYENTTRKSQFRRLLVAWYVWRIKLEWFSGEHMSSFLAERQEFAADLAITMAARITGKVNPFKTGHVEFREGAEDVDRESGHINESESSSTA